MEVSYSPTFIKMLKSLYEELQEEAIEKIQLFRDQKNHGAMKVHKLQGRLKGRYSFSVNFKTRIVFVYVSSNPKEACLIAIGDHSIYDK